MSTVGAAVTASAYLSDGRVAAQALRYLGTAIVLVMFSRSRARRGGPWTIRRPVGCEWLWLGAAATTGLTLYNLALVEAVQHADAPLVASIVSGVPLVLAIAGPLTARRRIGGRLVIGASAVVLGSAVMLGSGRSDNVGVVLALVALAGECAFTLLSVPVLARLGPASIATHTSWIAASQLVLLGAVRGDLGAFEGWDGAAWIALAYLVTASAPAFALWFRAIGQVGADRAGLAAGVIPIAALATGVPLGVAHLDLSAVVGTGIVTCGIALGLRARQHDPTVVRA